MTDGTMAPLAARLEPMTPAELKAWRREHGGISQAKLAEYLECSIFSIRHYEQGKRKIPPFLWRALRDLAAELEAERRLRCHRAARPGNT